MVGIFFRRLLLVCRNFFPKTFPTMSGFFPEDFSYHVGIFSRRLFLPCRDFFPMTFLACGSRRRIEDFSELSIRHRVLLLGGDQKSDVRQSHYFRFQSLPKVQASRTFWSSGHLREARTFDRSASKNARILRKSIFFNSQKSIDFRSEIVGQPRNS